jgi:hypothetical protein
MYTHEEVQILLDNAQLEGWKEGRKIGYEDGFKDGVEDSKEYLEDAKMQSYREGKDTGYKEARQQNAEVEAEEYEKGQLKGVHRGLQQESIMNSRSGSLKAMAQACAFQRRPTPVSYGEPLSSLMMPESKLTQTTTWSDASTQAAPRTNKMAAQTNDTPEHQCATLQMEPSDNEHSTHQKT